MKSYEHFTTTERQSLQENLKAGKSIRATARDLGKSPSSVSRELKRNSNRDGSYNFWRATTLYICRRKFCVRKPRLDDAKTRDFVVEALGKYWSPEAVSQRWKMRGGKGLSHSTIYRALKNDQLPGFSPKTHLRRRGKRKNTHKSQTIQSGRTIHERPEIVDERGRLGDLEGDTVYGGVGKGVLVTLVDRLSRFLYSFGAPSRDSGLVRDSIGVALQRVNVNSLTLDRGSEFARFREVEELIKAPVYFADPHSPWQQRPKDIGVRVVQAHVFAKRKS